MATETTLTTGSNSGSLPDPSSPQTSTAGDTRLAPLTQDVQPVSNGTLLDGQGGITLNAAAPLSTVSIPASSTARTGVINEQNQSNVGGMAWGFAAVLVFIAVAIFLRFSDSTKNTTD